MLILHPLSSSARPPPTNHPPWPGLVLGADLAAAKADPPLCGGRQQGHLTTEWHANDGKRVLSIYVMRHFATKGAGGKKRKKKKKTTFSFCCSFFFLKIYLTVSPLNPCSSSLCHEYYFFSWYQGKDARAAEAHTRFQEGSRGEPGGWNSPYEASRQSISNIY